ARLFAPFGLVLNPELAGLSIAMSSQSVVSNSLLLRTFRPGKTTRLSQVAPLIMVILFSWLFFGFAQFSTTMNTRMASQLSPQMVRSLETLFAQGKTSMALAPNGSPKLFFALDSQKNPLFLLKQGVSTPEDHEMVLGAEEAQMMMKEKLFQTPGDRLTDFFGVPSMRIVGILKPTRTILDMFHYVNSKTFTDLKTTPIQVLVAGNSTKLFLVVTPPTIPEQFREIITLEKLKPVVQNGETFLPIFLGALEAQMMKAEKLINKEGDILPKFFEQKVIVAGILPKTGTPFDMFHFVPEGFTFPGN
ncbi:MAG: hypothetical protein WCP87_03370, partial [Atribacterota bacterium]